MLAVLSLLVAVPVEPGKNTVMPWLDCAGPSAGDLGALQDDLRSGKPQPDIIEVRPRPARQ